MEGRRGRELSEQICSLEVHVVIHVTSVVDWFRMSTGGGGPERARVE